MVKVRHVTMPEGRRFMIDEKGRPVEIDKKGRRQPEKKRAPKRRD